MKTRKTTTRKPAKKPAATPGLCDYCTYLQGIFKDIPVKTLHEQVCLKPAERTRPTFSWPAVARLPERVAVSEAVEPPTAANPGPAVARRPDTAPETKSRPTPTPSTGKGPAAGPGVRFPLFGFPVTAVLRWMGTQGWTNDQARMVLNKKGLREVSDITIGCQVGDGRRDCSRGPAAALTKAQATELTDLLGTPKPDKKVEKKLAAAKESFKAGNRRKADKLRKQAKKVAKKTQTPKRRK